MLGRGRGYLLVIDVGQFLLNIYWQICFLWRNALDNLYILIVYTIYHINSI